MDEENIFLDALKVATEPERQAFLDQACGTNRKLRASVEALLKHHALAGDFLEWPPCDAPQTCEMGSGETLRCAGANQVLARVAAHADSGTLGKLGSYEILKALGRGGMGVVLQARDPKLNRLVAIKLMNDAVAADTLGRRRFLSEARSAAAVKHENVVTIHAIHDEEVVPYLVMEHVDGGSLQEKVTGPLRPSAREIAEIGIQLAQGLGAAHARGLVHRDIKPANLLLESETGRIKITDFGLARSCVEQSLAFAGELVGTPQYMSPEQARGERVDARSDLFSLGSVLYALCTGHTPFTAETAIATLRAICDDKPRAVSEYNSGIPRWLVDIIDRLLEKDPARRPQTAQAVADLLRTGLQSTAIADKPTQGEPTIRLAMQNEVPRHHRGSWYAKWLWGGAGAALLCAGVWIVLFRNGQPTRIEVPDGSTVTVTRDGNVTVQLDASAQPSTKLPATTPVEVTPSPAPSSTQDTPNSFPDKLKLVVAQLRQRNPGFDGRVTPVVQGSDVVELELLADNLRDLTPLKELKGLKKLTCQASDLDQSQLVDLTPLAELPLEWLDIGRTKVSDLAPLRNLKLQRFNAADAQIADLSPLKGMPLTHVFIQSTAVADLSPLQDSPLLELNISNTRVTRLSPIAGKKLLVFYCDSTEIDDLSALTGMPLRFLNWRNYDYRKPSNRQVVESLTALEAINSMPVGEFWRSVENGQ